MVKTWYMLYETSKINQTNTGCILKEVKLDELIIYGIVRNRDRERVCRPPAIKQPVLASVTPDPQDPLPRCQPRWSQVVCVHVCINVFLICEQNK